MAAFRIETNHGNQFREGNPKQRHISPKQQPIKQTHLSSNSINQSKVPYVTSVGGRAMFRCTNHKTGTRRIYAETKELH